MPQSTAPVTFWDWQAIQNYQQQTGLPFETSEPYEATTIWPPPATAAVAVDLDPDDVDPDNQDDEYTESSETAEVIPVETVALHATSPAKRESCLAIACRMYRSFTPKIVENMHTGDVWQWLSSHGQFALAAYAVKLEAYARRIQFRSPATCEKIAVRLDRLMSSVHNHCNAGGYRMPPVHGRCVEYMMPPRWTFRSIYESLKELKVYFGDRVHFTRTEIVLTTEAVELEDWINHSGTYQLGQFQIVLPIALLNKQVMSSDVFFGRAFLNNKKHATNNNLHPHLSGSAQRSRICCGEGVPAIHRALKECRLADAFEIVERVLHTYGDSPYVHLHHWLEINCPSCGQFFDPNHDSTNSRGGHCTRCHRHTCSKCLNSRECDRCHEKVCRSCRVRLSGHYCCLSCVAVCTGCNRYQPIQTMDAQNYCQTCHIPICERCHHRFTFDPTAPRAYMGWCANCTNSYRLCDNCGELRHYSDVRNSGICSQCESIHCQRCHQTFRYQNLDENNLCTDCRRVPCHECGLRCDKQDLDANGLCLNCSHQDCKQCGKDFNPLDLYSGYCYDCAGTHCVWCEAGFLRVDLNQDTLLCEACDHEIRNNHESAAEYADRRQQYRFTRPSGQQQQLNWGNSNPSAVGTQYHDIFTPINSNTRYEPPRIISTSGTGSYHPYTLINTTS
jgi:hypothetical protein